MPLSADRLQEIQHRGRDLTATELGGWIAAASAISRPLNSLNGTDEPKKEIR